MLLFLEQGPLRRFCVYIAFQYLYSVKRKASSSNTHHEGQRRDRRNSSSDLHGIVGLYLISTMVVPEFSAKLCVGQK